MKTLQMDQVISVCTDALQFFSWLFDKCLEKLFSTWQLRPSCQRCCWISFRRFTFVDITSLNESVDDVYYVFLQWSFWGLQMRVFSKMILLTSRHRIHALSVVSCPIAIIRHHNQSVLFNRMIIFSLRLLAHQQNFCTQTEKSSGTKH